MSSNNKKSKSEKDEPKSKRARAELIRLAVSSYIRDKRYSSSKKMRRCDLNLSQANKQFLFNKMVKDDAFINNFFLFSNVTCNSTNYKFVNEQFQKFVSFTEDQKLDVRVQLQRFYGPIICHLFLEILKGKNPPEAMDFLRNNVNHISADVDYICRMKTLSSENDQSNSIFRKKYFINLVKLLFTCPSIDAAENVREIATFRSSKFEIDVNIDAIQTLNEFLKNHANVLLLSTIHTWIHINVIDIKDNKSDNMIFIKDKERRLLTEMKPPHTVKSCKNQNVSIPKTQETNVFQIALKNIDHIMHEMSNIQQDYPHYVKVFDPDKFLTSGHCDKNQCHVAAGFDDSVIKLWQHSSQTLRGKNVYSTYNESICSWHVNNSFVEEEEGTIDRGIEEEEFPVGMNNQAVSGEIFLRGHSRGVTDLRFSAHYPLLLTVSKDESMRCWSASSYRCSRVYLGHNNPIWCVNESAVNSYVATGSKDLTARLWNLEREFPLITYVGHTQDINCLAFHPNGSYIATGSDDFSVRFWSVATGKIFRVFSESKQPITSLAFSPDGKFLAAAGEERKIRILDLAAGQQLCELKEHPTSISSIAWSNNGDRIASGSVDGILKIWHISKMEVLRANTTDSSSSNSNSSNNSSPEVPNPVTFCNNNLSRVCKVEYSDNNVLTCIGRK